MASNELLSAHQEIAYGYTRNGLDESYLQPEPDLRRDLLERYNLEGKFLRSSKVPGFVELI